MLGAVAAGDKPLLNRYQSAEPEVWFRKVRFPHPTWGSLLQGPEIPGRGPTPKRELSGRAPAGRHCPRTQGPGARAHGPARAKAANRQGRARTEPPVTMTTQAGAGRSTHRPGREGPRGRAEARRAQGAGADTAARRLGSQAHLQGRRGLPGAGLSGRPRWSC